MWSTEIPKATWWTACLKEMGSCQGPLVQKVVCLISYEWVAYLILCVNWDNKRSTRTSEDGPGIENFQIIGDAKPGFKLLGCGFPVRGTSLCMFQVSAIILVQYSVVFIVLALLLLIYFWILFALFAITSGFVIIQMVQGSILRVSE